MSTFQIFLEYLHTEGQIDIQLCRLRQPRPQHQQQNAITSNKCIGFPSCLEISFTQFTLENDKCKPALFRYLLERLAVLDDDGTTLFALRLVQELKISQFDIMLQDIQLIHKVMTNFQKLSILFHSVTFDQVSFDKTALKYFNDVLSNPSCCCGDDDDDKNQKIKFPNINVISINLITKEQTENNFIRIISPSAFHGKKNNDETKSLAGPCNKQGNNRIELEACVKFRSALLNEVIELFRLCQDLKILLTNYDITTMKIIISHCFISEESFKYMLSWAPQKNDDDDDDYLYSNSKNSFSTNHKFHISIDECPIYIESKDGNVRQPHHAQQPRLQTIIAWNSTDKILNIIGQCRSGRRLGSREEITTTICTLMDNLCQDPIYRSTMIGFKLGGRLISTNAIDHVIQNINKTNLQSLCFSTNIISNDHIIKLSFKLQSKNSTIKELDLGSEANGLIIDVGVQSLLNSLMLLPPPSAAAAETTNNNNNEEKEKPNMTLQYIKLPVNTNESLKLSIEYYLSLNRSGRKHIIKSNDEIPSSLWSILLTKSKNDASVMYWMIHKCLNIILWYQQNREAAAVAALPQNNNILERNNFERSLKKRRLMICD